MFRLAVAAVLLARAAPPLAQDRTPKIILGYPPGASSDVLTDYDNWGPVIRAPGFKPAR